MSEPGPESRPSSPPGAALPRVMQVMAGAKTGGAELYFARLCLALGRAGLPQSVVTRAHAPRIDELRAAGIPVAEARFGRILDFTTRRTIKRIVAEFRPRIVLSFMTRATQFVPRGGFVHIARLGGYYDLRHYRTCDHLIGNTPDLVEYFRRHGWAKERTHFIPNFVGQKPAEPVSRARYATPQDAPLVLALGRLHRNKAFDVLIGAMARMTDVYLWLAGSGPEHPALEKAAKSGAAANRIRFLGWQDDPAALMAAADAVAVPSRHEPLGNVILEAWAQGAPVVAAASQGPRFLVRDGENGLLVPPEDPDALAAALTRVLSDRALAARLADGGRAKLAAEFSEDSVVARYLDLFRTVLG